MTKVENICIKISPYNPVNYLACCGIVEVVSRLDSASMSYWKTKPEFILNIESKYEEKRLVECIVATLKDKEMWKSIQYNDGVVRISAEFKCENISINIEFDWWYETLKETGDIDSKSAWKMYAGRQEIYATVRAMVERCNNLERSRPASSFSEILKRSPMKEDQTDDSESRGAFGFDPRPVRNALDTGYSANDLGLPTPIYPYAELLAMIGIQCFFPHRTRQSCDITSSRGWEDNKTFRYNLWLKNLPIELARMVASSNVFDEGSYIFSFKANREMRDKYSNLSMAKPERR